MLAWLRASTIARLLAASAAAATARVALPALTYTCFEKVPLNLLLNLRRRTVGEPVGGAETVRELTRVAPSVHHERACLTAPNLDVEAPDDLALRGGGRRGEVVRARRVACRRTFRDAQPCVHIVRDGRREALLPAQQLSPVLRSRRTLLPPLNRSTVRCHLPLHHLRERLDVAHVDLVAAAEALRESVRVRSFPDRDLSDAPVSNFDVDKE